ncbi:Cobyric acid synthase [Cystobacter fuscus DSM 2262]|uniref:Cobyric acid synthase n=1 Tax=Cystobacter fuscus (strain ATCC 25194 / DSM 2262 / NBRC 100088 / M29) TaxID=1242864 RepID=S9NY15_CYSF2|nr:cobyric acid synthase [Cystobacter fuscus]EPX55776.1 Cobyric acid synthase [Cystobacter fuscus DSM 2262]
MKARTLMIQGTASSVGKSLLVTALCRIYARRGFKVAPFKSQNMALNSAVTPDGAEIGRAQYAQAEAARAVPCAEMNPILLKPETTSGSQVVVMGRVLGSMHFRDYHRRKPELREVVGQALDTLRERHELVIIEGAGSPAEVNLKDRDLVNMWVAERADAPVALVTDIERGGALAALVGTLELLEPSERARVRALVVNKFRGDPSLFEGGVRFLEKRCGIRVAGVIPHLGDTGIASEDSLDLRKGEPEGRGEALVCILRLPRLSNFDEFEPLAREPGVEVRWCERPEELEGARLVIIPGTKCTANDLAWLRRTGLAGALVRRVHEGQPVLGICGGYQMMGERILDPLGVESPEPDVAGLGLLPVVTRFEKEKSTAPVSLRLGEGLPGMRAAGGAEVRGYEIHCGQVTVAPGAQPFGMRVRPGEMAGQVPEGCVTRGGRVAGTLVHGLFENVPVRRALLAELGVETAGFSPADPYEVLADHFASALDLAHLDQMVGL